MKIQRLGTQLLVDLIDCSYERLNDIDRIKDILHESARISKASVIKDHFHRYSPHGVSGVLITAESHFSIHTWPEFHYGAVDIFTCGDTVDPHAAVDFIIKAIEPKHYDIRTVDRGYYS